MPECRSLGTRLVPDAQDCAAAKRSLPIDTARSKGMSRPIVITGAASGNGAAAMACLDGDEAKATAAVQAMPDAF